MSAGFVARFPVGSHVAGYRLEQQIGQGGMAVVFLARDERLQREVALKVLAPAIAADAAFRHRFVRESRSAAAVDDPHIIPVYEAGDAEGMLFIAMRYVPGGDAGSLVRRLGALPPARAAAVISAVASALDAAHAAGLVHRDVKPANMLMDVRRGRPDHVYLSDFGLTTGGLSSAGLTGLGQFVGTLDYAAPEQIEGRPVDARTDEYALACSAFELLTGEPPFRRDEGMAVLYAQLSAPPPSLTSRRPGLPPDADAVVLRALAKRPEDRYASCGEFAAALRVALGLPRYDLGTAEGTPDHPATEVVPVGGPVAGHRAATETAAPRPRPGPTPVGPALPPSRDRRFGARVIVLGSAAVLGAAAIVLAATLARSPGPTAGRTVGTSAGRAISSGTTTPAVHPQSSAPTGSPRPRSGPTAHHVAADVPAVARAFRDPGLGATKVNSVAFSPNGGTLAAGDADGDTYEWASATGRLIETLPGGSGAKVFAVAFSPGGKVLATGYSDGTAKVWQADSGQALTTIIDPGGKAVNSVAFSPDGVLLATGDDNGRTYLWRVPAGGGPARRVATLTDPVRGGVWAVAFSPDGRTMATTNTHGSTYLWNMAAAAGSPAPAETFTIPGGQFATAVAFSPDGRTLATGSASGVVYLWNLATGADTVVTEPMTVWAVAFSDDGRLAIGDEDGSTYLSSAAAEQSAALADPSSGTQGVGALAFSPDGRWLATGDSNGTTYLWPTR